MLIRKVHVPDDAGIASRLSRLALPPSPVECSSAVAPRRRQDRAILDSRNISGFPTGNCQVWNLSGHVKSRVTHSVGANAVGSAVSPNLHGVCWTRLEP